MNANSTPTIEKRPLFSGRFVAGGILVLVGLVSLLSYLTNLSGLVYLIGLGSIFLVWGLVTRLTGLLIPGSILTGIFGAITLVEGPFAGLDEPARGGVFLAAFAASWVLISLLSLYTESPRKWWSWPLYPAAILGLISIALFAGAAGLKALEIAGYVWPVILIAVGLLLVLKRKG